MVANDDEYRESDGDSDLDAVLSDDADVFQAPRGGAASRRAAAAAAAAAAGNASSSSARRRSTAAGGGVASGSGSGARRNGAADSVKKAAGVAAKAKQAASSTKDKGYAWEATYKRSWDAVREDEGGSLAGAVRGLLEASKRRRTLHDSAPVQRGIIRHLVLILDLSESMLEKDLRPSRFLLTLQYAREFVVEYFDQNPIGQLSILATREGVAERVTGMGGNTSEHAESLQSRKLTPKGEPSLQNALEMARSNLAHLPSANSREVLVLFGSLTTCDPGNIHDTIAALQRDNVRVSMVCLAAEVKVCKEICKRTHGNFGVALDEGHYRDLLFEHINPPEIEVSDRRRRTGAAKRRGADVDEDDELDEGVDLMQMGFPTRLPTNNAPTLCACHNRLKSGGYVCPRCLVKICDVPTDCPVCGLTVVMSTHLARSYHHLFPVANFDAIGWETLVSALHASDAHHGAQQEACLGCASTFAALPAAYNTSAPNGVNSDDQHTAAAAANVPANVAASGRYECPRCKCHFCLECDSFIHESLHQCPGCR